jgi:hypothetical protein
MKKNKSLFWKTEKRKISDLIPYQHNPRKITPEQEKQLTKSLEKFNLAEIPAINTDNTIIAGHQRLKIMQALGRGDEYIDVRVPSRKLTENELKEYNLRSNKNVGDWDMEILNSKFSKEMLVEVGFDIDVNTPNIKIPELISIFEVVITCEDENEQREIYEEFTKKGKKCRIITL